MKTDLFNTWTEESAYFLGVVSVIGEVDGTTLSIKAPVADLKWLRRVAAIIGLKKLSASNTFSVNHKGLTEPLWEMKNKHGSIANAPPEEYFRHFVRGMFDAGGGVCLDAAFTGKIGMLKAVRDRLIELDVISDKATLDSDAKTAKLKIVGPDVQKLGAFMYKGVDDLCLQYKRNAFELDKQSETQPDPEPEPEPAPKPEPKAEEKSDEPCELHRPGSERSGRPRTSGVVLRPRTRKEPNYDSLVR